ncbi:hypothetical protein FNV43_RR08412 [Rhamnella rubrinervis]|uniref:Disease resistance protein Roq1-like winged-helix domain-containing protein n=1 Tax=Rhamnella rubrinervis TaxID=2594499 RepID=A0A8K0MIR0_9ROSA|nr:hypothetical protein FNV43_RR08412 [Rhamnella rubrinervis]
MSTHSKRQKHRVRVDEGHRRFAVRGGCSFRKLCWFRLVFERTCQDCGWETLEGFGQFSTCQSIHVRAVKSTDVEKQKESSFCKALKDHAKIQATPKIWKAGGMHFIQYPIKKDTPKIKSNLSLKTLEKFVKRMLQGLVNLQKQLLSNILEGDFEQIGHSDYGRDMIKSRLRSSKRERSEWESALRRLENYPEMEIVDKLKISFDDLNKIEQCIFLDIACFFTGFDRDYVIDILDCCGFESLIGIRDLTEKSLEHSRWQQIKGA